MDKGTVDFQDNYDNSESEPKVLPAEYPNLLVNGAGGIAVGMATNIPPHNLGEVTDACLKLLETPETSIDELINIIPGPDFPTGGIILGYSGARNALLLQEKALLLSGERFQLRIFPKDKQAIIITEIPYQLNNGVFDRKNS